MYYVKYRGQYKSPQFNSFSEAYAYCKKQAPLIGYNYSYFEIYNNEIHYDITFKRTSEGFVESYRRCEKVSHGSNNVIPIVLHYGGSDQDIYLDRNQAIERIKEIAPKMAGKSVILIHGKDMWRTSFDGKTLHHQPVKLVNGEYVNIA